MPASLLSTDSVCAPGSRHTSSLSFEPSIPTCTGAAGFMEASLPRECELARPPAGVAPLWRLFGLVPRDWRRSGLFTAYAERRPGVSDLPPAALSQPSSL